MSRNYLIILIVAVLSLGTFFVVLNTGSLPTQNSGQTLDIVTFDDYSGDPYSLNQGGAKLIIVNSWASWCPFCRKELTDFVTATARYSSDDIAIIAINRSESVNTARRFSDELNISEDVIFLVDFKDKFYKEIGGFSMPETLFMDKDLNILEHKRGAMSEDEIKEKVDGYLKEL